MGRTDMARWNARGRTILGVDDPVPKVMGIVNLTPDSFSDGGQIADREEALAHARRLVEDGADLLDLGGESSRPGSEPVSLSEELRRIVPAVEALSDRLDVPISIDTTKAEVARRALEAGACIINDITAMSGDPDMGRVAAESGAGVVLMHMQGVPSTMQEDPRYADVVREVYDFLARRADWAESIGIPRDRIAIDPGIGFGKTIEHNLEILRNLRRFDTLGCAVVIGTSRKGFLGKITGRALPARATASVVSSLAACVQGARVVRVHDVAPMVDAIKVWGAVQGWRKTS
ncbi:MAG: dihydropteroate synthase [Isosphaeraceae bacterium]